MGEKMTKNELQAEILISLNHTDRATITDLAPTICAGITDDTPRDERYRLHKSISNRVGELRKNGWEISSVGKTRHGVGYRVESEEQYQLLLLAFVTYKYCYDPNDGPLTVDMLRAFVAMQDEEAA